MAHGVFRRLRDEINLATVIYRNAAFLETGDLSLGRFSLRNTAENPDEGTEALIESGKALEDFKIRGNFRPAERSLVLCPKTSASRSRRKDDRRYREPRLHARHERRQQQNAVAPRRPLEADFPRRNRREMARQDKPETFSVALAKLEAELKAGKPALAEYFACNLDEIAATFGLSTLEKNILCFSLPLSTRIFRFCSQFFWTSPKIRTNLSSTLLRQHSTSVPKK